MGHGRKMSSHAPKKWIQKAHAKSNGAFGRFCKNHGFGKPGARCVKYAMAHGTKHVRGMASFFANTRR